MDPMDPMEDPRIIGWWTIMRWCPNNIDPLKGQFPEDGFLEGGPLLIVKTGKGYSVFWPDKKQGLCSLDYSADAQPWVTFAGKDGFSCFIESPQLDGLNLVDPPALKLTVTLATDSGKSAGVSGNTGTFVAQAPPGGLHHGEPGHKIPENERGEPSHPGSCIIEPS